MTQVTQVFKVRRLVTVQLNDAKRILVALMDLGYITHTIHANSRLVYLLSSNQGSTLTVRGPPNENIYPPGPGWLYVVVDGVPSVGKRVIVGNGEGPPVDQQAINK
jgi:hypothetical protein